jgi:hypothetical protein
MYGTLLQPRRGETPGTGATALPSKARHPVAHTVLLLLVTMMTAYALGLAADDGALLPAGRPAIAGD